MLENGQIKPEDSRMKEIIIIGAAIKQKTNNSIIKGKYCFFEKAIKI